MNALKKTLIAAALGLSASQAGAALYTWNLNSNLAAGSGQACAGGAACKTTFTSTTGGLSLSARAYSTNIYDTTAAYDVSGNWIEGQIAGYGSSGLGVRNLNASDTNENVSPEHATDNQGVKDLVVFELPSTSTWNAQSFQLGWWSGDADVQAWVGNTAPTGNDFRNVCFSGAGCQTLTSLGFQDLGVRYDVQTGVTTALNTTATGKYLILAGELVGQLDAFKISQLVANTVTGPGGNVPEPATVAIFGLGLLMLSWLRLQRSAGVSRRARNSSVA
jgi:hypothetical protein